MQLKKWGLSALAGVALVAVAAVAIAQDVVVDPAIATMTAEQKVEAREAAMKDNGAILKSAGGLTGADAEAAADKLIQHFTD